MSATKPLTRTLQEGKDWTKTWQTKHKTTSKAFRIPADDLVACFNEMKISFTINASTNKLQIVPDTYNAAIRGYMAIDDKGEEKMLVVGTKTSDGINYIDITKDPAGDSAIYDFTTPCPNDCDPGSILNHKIK